MPDDNNVKPFTIFWQGLFFHHTVTGVDKHNISCFAYQNAADIYGGLNHIATWPVSSAVLGRCHFDSRVFFCVLCLILMMVIIWISKKK